MAERAARWRALALALAAGAVVALGQIPFGLPWLAFAAWAVVFAWGLPIRGGAAFARGWWLGFGHFLVALHWITRPFMVDPVQDGWMAPFGLTFMAGGMALFWGAAFWGASWLTRRGGPRLPALVVTLALAELLRSHVLTGFPWALIGHIWIDSDLAQTVRLWGAHGLTLLTLSVAVVTGAGLRDWRRPANALRVTLPVGLLVALTLTLDPGPAPAADPAAPLIRLVQPNVPQVEKTDPAAIPIYTRRLLDLSAAPGAPDLVVWPEVALPWMLDDMPDVLAMAAEAAGAPLVSGVQRHEVGNYYNSLALIGAGGSVDALYDKHHLVPFGEYIPFGAMLARWGIHGVAAYEAGSYSAGPGPAPMEIPGIGTALPLICYEGIFAEEIPRAPDARLMLLITNDAWFGNFAGPYQHFALGRLRSIEQGLPMVRVANTGVSAMIDGRGRVIASLPLNTTGIIDAALPPALDPPLYARVGDWPLLGLLLLGLGFMIFMRIRGIDAAPGSP